MLIKKKGVVLTNEEICNSPVDFLRTRFNGTVIKNSRFGVVFIENINSEYFTICQYNSLGVRQEPKHIRWTDFGDIQMARPPCGLYNTPWGVKNIYDRAQRQWSWGCSHKRVNTTPISEVRSNDECDMYWLLISQFPETTVFPQQLKAKGTLCFAISRTHYVVVDRSKDSVAYYNRFSRKLTKPTREMEALFNSLRLF